MYIRSQYGFTLVELLVVITIVGLLATLSVVALQNSREKARNSRRAIDARQVRTALEFFYDKYSGQGYPGGYCTGGQVNGSSQGWKDFVSRMSSEGLATFPDPPSNSYYHYCSGGGAGSYTTSFIVMINFEGTDHPLLDVDFDGTFWGADCSDPMWCYVLSSGEELFN